MTTQQLTCSHCGQVLQISGAAPSFCPYCGKALSATPMPDTATADYDPNAPTLAPGQTKEDLRIAAPETVGRYRLVRLLGSGGMGTVYEAEQMDTGSRVALKLISPEFAGSKETLDRFRQEGRLASAIAHPRCVFVLAADEADGRSFIAMELMPGDTLRDLVERQGPLPPEAAIRKIIDVIDGLQEAHRLEVIHRDVKPSNCFLAADGRVKVGDFGLAKSLVPKKSAQLTRTGTFLGTPYFASPEQIRGEPLDAQTDVYSVSATLYYLLTGEPPFFGSDATSTMARIVADPAPSMRIKRPELPPALDRIVLKGLERDRKRRYTDLDEFKQALLAFLPRQMSIGGMGIRLGAFLIDFLILYLALNLLKLMAIGVAALTAPGDRTALVVAGLIAEILTAPLWILYFAVGDGRAGCSPGKRLLRLRVRGVDGIEAPGFGRALIRGAIFYALIQMGTLVTAVLLLVTYLENAGEVSSPGWGQALLPWIWMAAGALVMMSTMRARNGYRGVHEIASKTRVTQLPWPKKRPTPLSTLGWFLYLKRSRRLSGDSSQADQLPKQVGGFAIRGALTVSRDQKVLFGEDPSLGRKVAIVMRSASDSPLSARRRDLGRMTRLRWVAAGKLKDSQWDAFLAPQGCPLPELIRSERRLPWSEVRPILDQLVEELAAARADDTVPRVLTVDQVWVQQNGRVQLVDSAPDGATLGPPITPENEEARCLDLLRQVACLSLEGAAPPPGAALSSIRAPLPEHARRLLDRLVGVTNTYTKLAELQEDLQATHDQPTEIDAGLRAGHLAVLAAFLTPLVLAMFLSGLLMADILGVADERGAAQPEHYSAVTWLVLAVCAAAAALAILGSAALRPGYSYTLMGITVVDDAGRRISFVQSALRAALFWLPIVLVLLTASWWPRIVLGHPSLFAYLISWLACWGVVVVVFLAYLAAALLYPARSLHDRIAGAWLVPK